MSKRIRSIVLISLIGLLLPYAAEAQRQRPMNLETFTYRPYHFGFILGFNTMNFQIHDNDAYHKNDSLFTIQSVPQSGFMIGIIANKKMAKYLDLRFSTVLSFGERHLNYGLRYNDSVAIYNKKIESTFIEFPLSLKYRSKRLNNFGAYTLAGVKYSIDLASQSDKTQQTGNYLLKIKKHDYAAEFGVGFDFYLPFFKFGIELKMAYGFRDLLVRENNIYTDPIRKLNSKIYLLSFTFEG